MSLGRSISPTLAIVAAACLVAFSIASILCGCARHATNTVVLDHEFLLAVARGQTEAVNELLKKGANVDTKDRNGQTALFGLIGQCLESNCNQNTMDIVKLLLENRANTEVRDVNGSTPLVMAAGRNAVAMVRLLLDNGADINARD
jgi:uncharacterized protein